MAFPSVARQPIFDRRLRVWAYELLFRDSQELRDSPPTDETATAKVIVDALMDVGLERVAGPALALINVPRPFIVGTLPLVLPPRQVCLEVLETVRVDDELVSSLAALADRGFLIALDDFTCTEAVRPLLEVADVVKLEVNERSQGELQTELQSLGSYRGKLLAEKVETYADFERCLDLGFDYFQGFFFATPRIIDGSTVSAALVGKLRLAAALQRRDLDLAEVESIVETDIALCYRLLRYLNSAYFGLPRTLHSIREAIVMLGDEAFRRWAAVLLIAGVEDKPSELVALALTRARMCELLCAHVGEDRSSGSFVVGLFSVLDAVADAPLPAVLEALPLADTVVAALTRHEGPAGEALARVLAYERGAFALAVAPPYDPGSISDAYVDAVAWMSMAMDGLA